jgi:hypothetical protein
LSYQILKIWQRVDEEERAFKGSEEQRAAYNKVVEALATEEAQALRDARTRDHRRRESRRGGDEASAKRQVGALATVTQGYYQAIDAAMALIALKGLDSSTGKRTTTPNDGSQGTRPRHQPGVHGAGQRRCELQSVKIPSHKDGGPTVEGPAYLHNDEYVVPKNGALVMNGGGGSSVVVNVYVTQPLASPSAIAAAVDQALTARQLNLGTRFPARI